MTRKYGVLLVLPSPCHLDIALVIERSSRVEPTWNKLVNSMADFVSSIEVGKNATHIGVVSFGMYCNFQSKPYRIVL